MAQERLGRERAGRRGAHALGKAQRRGADPARGRFVGLKSKQPRERIGLGDAVVMPDRFTHLNIIRDESYYARPADPLAA